MKIKACGLDTETTGFVAPVIPLQLVYLPIKEELNKLKPFTKKLIEHKFNPGRSIEYGAMAAHGIRQADVAGEKPWDAFAFPLEPEYFIGHNVDFDVDVIRASLQKAFEPKSIDTCALAQLAFPEIDSYKLVALAYFIEDHGFLRKEYEPHWQDLINDAHGAEADVHMCMALMFAICDRLAVNRWDKLFEYSEVARIPVKMPFGKHRGEEIMNVPSDYRRWLSRQEDVDKYLMRAITMPRDTWNLHMERVTAIREGKDNG